MFFSESRLDALTQKFNSTPMVTFAKGYNEITISRKAVDYIFAEIDLQKIETMMDRQSTYGVDELMFPTLLTLDQLNIPGSFTQECLNVSSKTDINFRNIFREIPTLLILLVHPTGLVVNVIVKSGDMQFAFLE